MKRFIIALLAIGFFFSLAFSVQAEPVREKGKAFYRDMIERVQGDKNSLAKSSAAKLTVFSEKSARIGMDWKIQTNGRITCSPAIGADGTIYFGSNDSTFYAIDPLYGGVKWWKQLKGMSISSPVIGEDGTIFTASTSDYEEKDKPRSFVYAFNPDGSLKWEYEINPGQFEDGVYNSPTIWKNNNSGTPNWLVMIPSQKGDSLIALDPATGLEVHEATVGPFYTDFSAFPGMSWRKDVEGFCEGAYTGFFPSTPRRDLIVAGTRILDPVNFQGINYFPGFQIFSRSGEKKARYLFEPYFLAGNDSTEYYAAHMFATPAIDRDGTIYFGTARGGIFYAFYPDGSLKWKREIEQQLVWDTLRGIGSSAVIGEENVFFTTQHGLIVCLSKFDGREIWKKDINIYMISSPVLSADGTLYICTAAPIKAIIAVNSVNGFVEWQYETDNGISSSPVLNDQGILYVGCLDGCLYAINTGTGVGLSKAPWPMYGRDARHSASADPNPLAVQDEKPLVFVLEQNSPNPFNPSTLISFALPKAGQARLEIYNATGQKVATLANGLQTAGKHSFVWDAKSFASGIYFYVLKAEGLVQTKKMVLLK